MVMNCCQYMTGPEPGVGGAMLKEDLSQERRTER